MKNYRLLSLFCACIMAVGSVPAAMVSAEETAAETGSVSASEEPVYRIIYSTEGSVSGRVEETDPVEKGEIVRLSPWALRRDGYTHTGWTDGDKTYSRGEKIKMPDRDLCLTPVWKKVYTLKYEKLEEIGYATVGKDGTVSPGSQIYLPNLPMHNGDSMFNGWLVNGVHVDPASTISMPEMDTYIAVDWLVPVKLDYYSGPVEGVLGEEHFIKNAYPGFKTDLSDKDRLKRLGYKLVGWYDPDDDIKYDLEQSIMVPDRDITMLAVWDPIKVGMEFKPNGGTGKMPNQVEYFDSWVQINECTFTNEGYKLNGWKNGDDYYTPGATVQAKVKELGDFMTLEAVWIEEGRNPGDLDGDGAVTLTDLSVLSLHVIGDQLITDEKILDDADVERDGEVNTADLARMMQFIAKQKILLG